MKNEINWFFLYTLALTSQQQGCSVIQAGVKERGVGSFRVHNLPLIGATVLIYRLEKLHICSVYFTHSVGILFSFSLSLSLCYSLVADVFLSRCLGVENQGDNETVKTQNFSENQDQDL